MGTTETLIEKVEHAIENVIHEAVGGSEPAATGATEAAAGTTDAATTTTETPTTEAAPVHPASPYLDQIEALALKWGGDVGVEIRNLVGSARAVL